jgi:hypothetical protein
VTAARLHPRVFEKMSAQGSAPAHDLPRFVALLQQLDEEGIESLNPEAFQSRSCAGRAWRSTREAFAGPGSPRERWAPAKRLMQVMGLAGLPDRLALELIPLAHTRPLRRFLAGRISSPTLVNQLLATAESDAERAELGSIVARQR